MGNCIKNKEYLKRTEIFINRKIGWIKTDDLQYDKKMKELIKFWKQTEATQIKSVIINCNNQSRQYLQQQEYVDFSNM